MYKNNKHKVRDRRCDRTARIVLAARPQLCLSVAPRAPPSGRGTLATTSASLLCFRGDLEQRHPRRQGRCLDADRRCRIWLPETTTPRTPLNTYDQRTASSLRRPTVTSPHSGPMALVLAEAQLQAQEVVEDAWDLHRRRCALGVRRDRASLCVCGYRLFVWCGHRLSVCGYRLIV